MQKVKLKKKKEIFSSKDASFQSIFSIFKHFDFFQFTKRIIFDQDVKITYNLNLVSINAIVLRYQT
jgi:hypothetical protein